MNGMTLNEKEYEALATIRDILLLLYSEIRENSGCECRNLRSAFEYVDGLVGEMGHSL